MDGRARTRTPRTARPALRALVLIAAGSSLIGCGSHKLETGYAYSPLGKSATQRRAYYAGPFSPEAREAMRDPSNDAAVGPDARRPRPGL